MIDLVQKGLPVTKKQSRLLHVQKHVRGRYPRLAISAEVAAAIGAHGRYVRTKGLDNSVFKELILELLRVRPCSRAKIIAELNHALAADLTTK